MTRCLRWPALLVAGVAACSDGFPEPLPPSDSLLVLSPTGLTLTVGTTQLLSAVLVVAGTDTVVVQPGWSSRNGAVASVTDAGLVAGVGAGSTHVVAALGGVRDSAPVVVAGSGATPPPSLRRITGALNAPVFATAAPGDPSRLFVVEQGGTIRVLRHDTLLSTPFLDIRSAVSGGGEQGLLSMAFHPSYAVNGYVYVSYTDVAGTSKVVRYQVSGPEIANPTTASEVLSVPQPYANHNGGLVTFGPDGMLYVGLGDGGSGGDPHGHGQNLGTLLGSILRIDVDGASPYAVPADNPFVHQAGARGEIWMYGLRNPWRFSFDRSLGDLYVGDVGQSAREEVDVVAAPIPGGVNFGWNIMEGTSCYGAATCQTTGLTLPLVEYTHADGCSVTGGFVYRGSDVPQLQGRYLYADYCGGWVRSFTYVDGRVVESSAWPDLSPGTGVTSFAEDARGEVYIMTHAGVLSRIVQD
jgi:glucose/arabinose dehydrogenase